MTKPLVSVVIPAYNHERFIGAGIDSVLNQSMSDLELIIVDDGSTDNTAEVIKAYDDPRISYTWQENQDAYNTLNRGMGMAHGQYISILNSDDVYTTDRFEKCLQHIEQTGAEVVFSDVIPIDDEGNKLTEPDFGWNLWHQKNRNYYFLHDDVYIGFLNGNYMVTTSNLFMTREAVQKTGQFTSLRYLHDYDYIFRLMLACPGKVSYLHDQQLLYYRIHGGNTLSEAAITGREQDLEVIEKYMLASLPEEYRERARTGSNRLRQLEREIIEVKAELAQLKQINPSRFGRRAIAKARRMLGKR
jgi:glycosyltransferase involved in cell wall biosynthesis